MPRRRPRWHTVRMTTRPPADPAPSRAGSAEPPPSLGTFLRQRRMRLRPEDVGIPRTAGRNASGLRRAELADLADISLSYYTFIERGRDLRPSAGVLDSIGRALQLTAGERRMLNDLRAGVVRRTPLTREESGDEIEELVEVLEPNPTYVMGACWDILTSNRSANLLFTNWNERPARERNMLWYYLCEPSARELYVDWAAEAADQMAHFRETFAQRPDDPTFTSLLEEIFTVTPQARVWWESHDAEPSRSGVKRIRIPDGRQVLLRQLVLQSADNPEIQIVTYFADMSGDEEADEEGDDDDE